MNKLYWWFATMAFFFSLGGTLISVIRFGAAVGAASGPPMLAMVGCGLLSVIFQKLRRHYKLLFCIICDRDLVPGHGLDEDGRPTVAAAAIIRGRKRFVGALCPDCSGIEVGGKP